MVNGGTTKRCAHAGTHARQNSLRGLPTSARTPRRTRYAMSAGARRVQVSADASSGSCGVARFRCRRSWLIQSEIADDEVKMMLDATATSDEPFLLIFNMNHPRLCRTLLAERHYVLTWFSGRTPDISGVGFPILARPGELYTWYSKLCFCQSARPLGRAEFPRPLRKGHV